MTTPVIVRVATDSDDDRLASARLSSEAFGYSTPRRAADVDPLNGSGRTMYLAERGGAVVGKAADREYDSWFGGREVPTSGVASVTVAVEERGRGTMRALMVELMGRARDRGAVLSTLVPTVPGVYRGLGYESVTTYEHLRLPTQQLARVTAPRDGTTRRATPEDWPDIEAVYDTWAAAQNGPLTRRGPSFTSTPADVLGERAFTLALDAGGSVVGYASWRHTGGYYGDGLLEVDDVIALTRDGYRLLLAALGSTYAVAPTTELMSSGSSGLDLLRLVLPDRPWTSNETDHYMLAILDVPGAFEARGYPSGLDATVRFAVAGSVLDDVDGAYELTVRDGSGRCRRVDAASRTDGSATFTPGGLALLYSGAQSCANISAIGGLVARELPAEGSLLDALFGGRQVHIRDSF
ncbi:GNAT family N-acetyltransferase [Mobilicoccus massiliensis]|uniref:GNAT family N-acetyltransferase n=1 Tax=Mobilicoccus massiliensis TaxID=1522310 RepID=UPI001FEB937B|nr:GNAT family N-acetyltransferase [Mobilicoccus massiliensis]